MSATVSPARLDPPEPGQRRHARRPRRSRRSPGAFLVGLVGELLITLGVLLGLFVVWQLWWTDVEAMQEQQALIAQADEGFAPSPETTGVPSTDDPPAEAAVGPGELVGTLWVPRWDGSDPYRRTISEGIDRTTVLDTLGIGHYPDTATPGQVGNFAIAGHRQTHGKPFYDIDKLQAGDPLVVETAQGWYVYRVTESLIVTPQQTSVIAPNPGDPGAEATGRMITLTTCHPLFTTLERYIVHGELDYWMPRESGRPAEIAAEGES